MNGLVIGLIGTLISLGLMVWVLANGSIDPAGPAGAASATDK